MSKSTAFGAGVAVTLALAGCTPEGRPQPDNSPSAAPTLPPLEFQRNPAHSTSYAYCGDRSDSWAVQIDNYPNEASDALMTVAAAEGDTDTLRLLSGATVRKLGQGAYQIATSEHVPGTSSVVDLDTEYYARTLKAHDDYGIVFSARKGDRDGNVYFRVNCLPNFGFHGDQEQVVPLDQLPTAPPPSTPPVAPPPLHHV